MPNPILIFLDFSRFPPQPYPRQGLRSDGTIEALVGNAPYDLILMGDHDDLADLVFTYNVAEAVSGAEHGGRPVTGTKREGLLRSVCSSYECVHTFSHDGKVMFTLLQGLLAAHDTATRAAKVAEVVAFVRSLDQWNAMIQWLMNEQSGLLGGEKLDRRALPLSAAQFSRQKSNGNSYKTIIEKFTETQCAGPLSAR